MPEPHYPQEKSTTGRKVAVLAIAGLLVLALIAYANFGRADSDQAATVGPTPAVASASPTASASAQADAGSADAADNEYKDGTYTATGTYRSPGGSQSIGVTLTIANDVVTGASINQQATDRESAEYQAKFASGFQSLVVGKSVDELNVARVSGSSLTSTGFNNAVSQIKSQAGA